MTLDTFKDNGDQNPAMPDAGQKAKEKLEQRRQSRVKKFIKETTIIIAGVLAVIAAGFSLLVYSMWGDRVVGDEILYGTCFVDLGDYRVTGKRQFVRPYTDAFGMRYINPHLLSEEILIDNEDYGVIIVSMTKDGESHVTITKPEMGRTVNIPLGEKYLFVHGEESDVISHGDLCF